MYMGNRVLYGVKSNGGSKLAMLGSLLWLVALAEPITAQLPAPRLYVNADSLTEGDGSPGAPFMTLNMALEEAYELLNPPPPGGLAPSTVDIIVQQSTIPIAPATNGGKEAVGWQKWNDPAVHKPFPIRMIEKVNIIGVARLGIRPMVMINETPPNPPSEPGFPPFGASAWESGLPRALFRAASNTILKGLRMDGTLFVQSKATTDPSCVSAEDVTNFAIENCDMVDWHDGVHFKANAGFTTTATITGGTYSDFFPVTAFGTDEGHAAIWLEGLGTVNVDVSGAVFQANHDAVEILGQGQTATLDVTECTFMGNENGLEAVGVGQLGFTSLGSVFDSNINLPNGIDPLVAGVGGIVVRGMNVTGVVRDCTFMDNGFGVSWTPWQESNSSLDLGQDSSGGAGHNQFLPFDPQLIADPTNDFRVHVFNGVSTSDSSLIFAARNTWIPLDSGADSVGCLLNPPPGVPKVGPVPASGIPPGPDSTSVGNRNYSIGTSFGKINFGNTCDP